MTENFLIPIIENSSGLEYKKDFFVAYSPERINPGETKYKLTNIKKVVGADTKKTLKKYEKEFLAELEKLSKEERQNVLEKSRVANQILAASSKTN